MADVVVYQDPRRHHHHHHHRSTSGHRHHSISSSGRRGSHSSSSSGAYYSSSRRRARSLSPSEEIYEKRIENSRRMEAGKAALAAGAIEAWRSRKLDKQTAAMRAGEAALGAGAINYYRDRDMTRPGSDSKMHIAKSVAGGLLAQKAVSGGRRRAEKEYYYEGGYRPGRGGTNVADLAALAVGALAGRKAEHKIEERHHRRRYSR